jgi:protein dispatched 1
MFLFISSYTGSMFLACASLIQIMEALGAALLLYKAAWAMDYYEAMNVAAIFLCLGIGVDNLFIFVDSWKEARKQILPSETRDFR